MFIYSFIYLFRPGNTEVKGGDLKEEFIDVEMKIDVQLFEGSENEIEPGKFVSYRYTGEHASAGPINPTISLFY